MSRIAKWSLVAALGVVAVVGNACASDPDTDVNALLTDCGSPNIERSDIDSCLARARDMSETAPSTKLQGLTARLERRAEALDDGEAPQPAETSAAAASSNGGSTSVAVNASSATAAPH